MFMKLLTAFAAFITIVVISLGCGSSDPAVEDASDVADASEAGAEDAEVMDAEEPADAAPADAEEPADVEVPPDVVTDAAPEDAEPPG